MGKKNKITASFVQMPKKTKEGKYFDADKPRPQWAKDNPGTVPFTKFAKAWQQSGSVEDVQRRFHWFTTEQLKKERGRHNRYIRDTMVGVMSLKNLKSEADRWRRNEEKMKKLIEAGILEEKSKKEAEEPETSTIDRLGVGSLSADIDHMNDAPPLDDFHEE